MARIHARSSVAFLVLFLLASAAATGKDLKLDGYAEYREADVLVVEGQRVRAGGQTRFDGKGEARSFASIPLGFEVEVEGERLADGSVLARKIKARPNGQALFEEELKQAFDETEASYRREGAVFELAADGKSKVEVGRLEESGRRVERVRRITRRLVPPYLGPGDFRVYVVDNEEWNAMAAPNRSIYVFRGLLDDMDDDEVAIVLGHELAHSTHEHSRQSFKKAMLIQLAALGGVLAAEQGIEGEGKRTAVQLGAMLGATAWQNGYGRRYEDQADRVGLRYAHEGGFDVDRGPRLWQRFEKKYGARNKAANFFFGSHSVAKDRARNLEREIGYNYPRR